MINKISECLKVAVPLISKRTQDKVMGVRKINKNRHYCIYTEKHLSYYLLYKRDFFNSFGKIFNLKGCGESINMNFLQYALRNKFDAFLIMYQKGYVYVVPPQEFIDYAIANNTIRETKSGEITASVPLGLLRRWR